MNLDSLVQWIHLHPHWGGFITMLISAAESVAILGTIVPGSVMMTAIGTLIGTGVLPIVGTLIWAIVGAIIGDGISYWLGYAFKDRIRSTWPFSRYPKILESGENFFRRHGAKSVFFGRFVGPVRAIVPLIAGMIGMRPLRFYTANVLSAIAWAPAYMAPGFLLGAASLQLPPNLAIHLILSLLIILVAILFFTWLIRLLAIRLGRRLHLQLDKFWLHLQRHKHEHFITTLCKSSDHTHVHGQLGSALTFIIFTLLFLILAGNVAMHTSLTALNQPIYYFFRGLRLHGIDQAVLCITFLGEKTVLFPLMGILFIAFCVARHFKTAWHCLALMLITGIFVYGFKLLVHSPRPGGLLLSPLGYSFPSGHVTLSVAFYGFICMLLLKHIRSAAFRKIIYYGYIVLIALVMFSRLYLGAHWITDVIGALLLGSACFLTIKISYYREETPDINPRMLLLVTLVSLAVLWTWYFMHHFQQQSYDYQRTWPTIIKSESNWWQNSGDTNILYRNDRLGYPKEALNIQWAGDLDTISSKLEQQGFQAIQKFYWSDFLHPIRLAQRASIVPIIPRLYRNSTPELVLVKKLPSAHIIVLRLWNTHIVLTPNGLTLWVGLVNYHKIYKERHENQHPMTPAAKALTMSLQYFTWKLSPYPIKQITKKKHTLTLSGQLLLIKPKEAS